MQKTQNYNLNQWEPTDPIRREDFNADNAAIDAALVSMAGNTPYVVGSYASTNNSEKDVVVELGFQPSMVVVCKPGAGADYGTLCTREVPAVAYSKTILAVTETGFNAGLAMNNDRVAPPYTNYSGTYVYIAFQ